MPIVTIEGVGPVEAEVGRKLVNVIEGAGVDILHRCGGRPACTTCMVKVKSGTVSPMESAEEEALEEPELIETCRLSCQIRVESDLTVEVIHTVTNSGKDGAGPSVDE